MRTPKQIIARINDVKNDDWLGTQTLDLVFYLEFDNAKEFLKPDAVKDEWVKHELTQDRVLAEMHKYIPFAWDKCLNHRGISAGRSINHFRSWIWLLGDDAVLLQFENTDYAQYGAPQLRMVCEQYSFSWPEEDEAIRRMSMGDPCGADFACGCGT